MRSLLHTTYRLLGEQRDFDSLTLYRSYVHFLRDGPNVAGMALKGWMRQGMLWLLSPERRSSPLTQAAIKSVRAIRRLKQRMMQLLTLLVLSSGKSSKRN